MKTAARGCGEDYWQTGVWVQGSLQGPCHKTWHAKPQGKGRAVWASLCGLWRAALGVGKERRRGWGSRGDSYQTSPVCAPGTQVLSRKPSSGEQPCGLGLGRTELPKDGSCSPFWVSGSVHLHWGFKVLCDFESSTCRSDSHRSMHKVYSDDRISAKARV